jgi:hypothetical protein
MNQIRFALLEFLDLSPVACFNSCYLDLYKRLAEPRETRVERGEFVTTDAYERIPDLAKVSEIARLLADLEQWQRDIADTRENWLYANGVTMLPGDCNLYEIFGDACTRLEQLRHRARLIAKSFGTPINQVDILPTCYRLWQVEEKRWPEVAAEAARLEGDDFDSLDKDEQAKAADAIRDRVRKFAQKNNLPLRQGKRGNPGKTRQK